MTAPSNRTTINQPDLLPGDTAMSGSVQIRFYEELNDFLPPEQRRTTFQHPLKQPGSIKNMIEALGVPTPKST